MNKQTFTISILRERQLTGEELYDIRDALWYAAKGLPHTYENLIAMVEQNKNEVISDEEASLLKKEWGYDD